MERSARLDPAVSLIWTVNVSLAATAASSIEAAATLFALVIVAGIIVLRESFLEIRRYWRLLVIVPVLLFFFHASCTPGQPLVGFGPLSMSREGTLAGTAYMLRLGTSVAAALIVIRAIDLSAVAPSLMRVGVPRGAAFSVYLMLRFVPLMAAEAETVRLALLTRMPAPSLRDRLLRFRRYLLNLVVASVRHAEQTALAMDARGFATMHRRTTIHDVPLGSLESASIVLVGIACWTTVYLLR